jgi:hypothetical protein
MPKPHNFNLLTSTPAQQRPLPNFSRPLQPSSHRKLAFPFSQPQDRHRTGTLMNLPARRTLVTGLLIWVVLSTSIVTALNWQHRNTRAVVGMGWGLIILWIFLGGALMLRFRNPISALVNRAPGDWRLKFVLFATLLALLEEAVTTSMTNLAPLFGVKIGEAYITASANYLDVVALHSVIMFVPMFVGWAVILWRYQFSPFSVFLLFGLTGTMAESLTFGLGHLLEFAFWIFVYGLMVYLPACCIPPERPARTPRWWFYPLAIFIPFLFMPLVPLPLIPALLFPHHPKIHFPPISHG